MGMIARTSKGKASRTLTIRLPRLHDKQVEILSKAGRRNVLRCGRQFGKTTLSQTLIIEPALKGLEARYYAPTYKALMDFWRDITEIVDPIVRPGGKSQDEHRLELLTGGVIEMWSLDDPDASRGRHSSRVVIDEAAYLPKLAYSVDFVIRATLLRYHGDLWILSTPKGLNDFYRLGKRPGWTSLHYTTFDNPYIDKAEIEQLRSDMPERAFRQEIMAEFIENGGFFQQIDQAAVVQERERPEDHAGHTFVAACDWALSEDYTIVAVGCRECNRVVDWERFNQMDYTYQRAKVVDLYRRWGCQGILPERNSIGQPNIEMLSAEGLWVMPGTDGAPGFVTSATTKPMIVQGLAGAIEHGGFKVPVEAADELRSFEVLSMASGHLQFKAPSGEHDDWVMALALLWNAMTNVRPLVLFGVN